MYDFFINFINNASFLVDMGRRQIEEHNNIVPNSESVVNNKTSENINKTQKEVEIISKLFGGLKEDMRIEIELNRILEILPRTRRKADAYKGLRSKLKQQGVELVITSNGHLKNKK